MKFARLIPEAIGRRRSHQGPIQDTQKRRALEFYIQVGVFSDFDNAERLKDTLLALETPIKVEATMLNSGIAFRVKIGPLNDIEVADDIVSRLGLFDIHDHRILLK